jgi:exodeoxyribonuclease VII small subunit
MASFEEQLDELEKVVEKLERGDLTLEENVALFERGVQLSNACKKDLVSAESRIQVLLDPKENGPVRAADLDLDVDDEMEEDADEDGRL